MIRGVSNLVKRATVALEEPVWFVSAAIVFRLGLEIGYRYFVNPLFDYHGFALDVDWIKYAESWFIYLLLILASPKCLRKTSDFLMVYLLFYVLAPLLVFYALANASREHLYIVLTCVFLVAVFRRGRPIRLPIIVGGSVIGYVMLLAGVFAVTLWMIYSGGLSFFNLDFRKVYDFRGEVGEVINQGYMAYLNTWAMKVFGPMLLAVALWTRNYILAVLVVGLHIIWFGISAHKAALFYPFLVVFVWIWFRNSRALALIPLGMVIVVCLSFSIYLVWENVLVSSLLIRRVFFVPPFLIFTYYDFFSDNQFVYWASSITSAWIEYPYDMVPAKVIGAYLGTDAHANNSFLSTGYMHAGVSGVVFYGVLVGFLFRIIDSLSYKGVPPWVAVASLIVPAHALLGSADLPTSILTHGIGVALVVLFLLRSASVRKVYALTARPYQIGAA